LIVLETKCGRPSSSVILYFSLAQRGGTETHRQTSVIAPRQQRRHDQACGKVGGILARTTPARTMDTVLLQGAHAVLGCSCACSCIFDSSLQSSPGFPSPHYAPVQKLSESANGRACSRNTSPSSAGIEAAASRRRRRMTPPTTAPTNTKLTTTTARPVPATRQKLDAKPAAAHRQLAPAQDG